MDLKEYLKTHRLFPDGSMGTYYCSIVNQQNAISERANLSAPDIIKKIHIDYIKAGAGLLRTNTFAASRAVLRCSQEEQRRIVKAACAIAKDAVATIQTEQGEDKKVWILGDIGPIPQDAETSEEEIIKEYQFLCDIFLEEGMDGIHFETFSSTYHIEKLVPYIKSKKESMFILASFSVNKNGYSTSGISANRLLDHISQLKGIDACGLNCGVGSGHMQQILRKINLPEGIPLYAAPNAGYPEQLQNRMVFMDNARYFANNMKQIAELGVAITGGCCGTTPEYITSLVEMIGDSNYAQPKHKGHEKVDGASLPGKENEFYQLLQSGKKVVAVELDPPYDADIDRVMECAHKLKTSSADIITFADSPMGRSRVDSVLMSIKIAEETGLRVMPHICCRDRNIITMRSTLLGAYIHGIRNLLLVTGDPVPGESRVSTTGVFDYNSVQLMDYVKEMNIEHFPKEPFCFGGALNHNRGSIEKVVERLQRKIAAGARYFLTQPIYSREDVDRIKSIKERLDTKILCGIMPLVSYKNARFIKNEMPQINVPDEIMNRYHPDMSREEAEEVGASIARELIEMLDPIADGYYIMLPFNRVSLMDKIFQK
ncbi:MAG: Methionine synthase (cobalamin-dependent), methyltransferase domain [Herbinix sp.]|nr:Methionine synthase (cobalamin-dependent), methyltransferase domain [Herbinix sp.]